MYHVNPNNMADQNKKDFATIDTESFQLGEQLKSDAKRVIINIDEENKDGIVLDKKDLKGLNQGGFMEAINQYLVAHSKVKIQDKATFFHLLGVMVNAGIPMVTALNSLVAQSEKSPRLKMVVEALASKIEGGTSLSVAMASDPDIFIEQEIGMVQSGEASGQLNKVLENLAKDTEKAYTIKSKVKSAMMYPVIVFMLLIAVIFAMMVFVVPKLTQLFENSGAELPLITRIVVWLSDFMVNQKFVIVVGVIAIYGAVYAFNKTDVGRYFFDGVKIKLPIFGPLFKKSLLSRFARSISNLMDSSITIINSLQITANSIGNEVYKKRILLAVEDIKQGIPLAENLMESDLFPPMLVNMIDVGEKTAQLDTITAKVADFYESEVDTAVAGISKIIEPVILVVIGLSVGAVVAAIMLPIMQLSNVAGAV